MQNDLRNKGLATRAIHAGEEPDPTNGASAPALHMSSTFVTGQVAGFSAHDLEEEAPYLYGRWANPNVRTLETKISALEGTEDCICLASGMAAATAIFLTFLSAGDHVIVSDVSYAGVAELARDTLPRLGIEVSTVNMSDLAAVSAAIRPNTRLIHTETPVNPIGRLTDLAAVSAIAQNAEALLSCDATFASPLGQPSKDLGVDLIMHSVTKFIGGHGDAIGGAVAGRKELIEKIRNESAIHHGSIMSPFNAWMIARGMATLPLRMKAHQAGAMALTNWLETRGAVTKVVYPGLKSHPQYELAQRQMRNSSGMITFQVGDNATGEALAQQMIDKLKIVHYAVSLGHHRSLIFWMGTEALMQTSFRLEGAQLESYRDYAGDGVFRLSVGLEDPEDLIADLEQVL
ncbi:MULTISPECIES: PLP-dependent aspartate aminotransferase family protein [unclassified Ruegeria]|uniref:trans-sulfuration enzyme family protein n=1 Tax=unclassified Ruegeria TaxID=2625375 RepID=UPI001489F76C|nr:MULTISPECIES: PLP-dependent aspartate aminotransferase family protein [unclassified Ruegeria]NOD76462.1 aminotransferase class V-fold PLP-dependent enzyme [Ruegeria sp. HKCCD4332]NOD89182.1 aminotransferase class V-fold PLP-dependent enzyme [Ruegeria sp. HKCCD4318]NOE13655.1 aminotransferase class V-fold PLP-dependent enzyme [Ruegeria sp. HKCCD4318-2]NOG07594.1 PLP-dependent transferase [Ruegeria sp. HKCCD4315]